MTDVELVARARRGESAAFGELVIRHQTAVFRTALAAVRDASEAEDVAQEAFLNAFERLATFRGEASFRTWLLAIAWNTATRRRRALWRRWRMHLPLVKSTGDAYLALVDGQAEGGGPLPQEIGSRDGEAELRHADLRRAVHRVVRALPRRLRDPLLLAGTGESRYEEIAAMLGIPVGTVKWRVSEARRHVKERLRRMGYLDG